MLKTILRGVALALLLATAGCANAQSTLLQGGPQVAGHVPMYVGTGSQPIVQDSGTAAGGSAGVGLSELGITARGTGTPPYVGQGNGPLGTNFCNYDAPITNATGYHYLCLSPNVSDGGLIAYGSGGGASDLPLRFSINGATVTLPTNSGDAFATVTLATVDGELSCFSGTAGLLTDCTAANANLANMAAATLKGNPTASSAVPTDFTLSGLTARGAPDSNNDKMLILDNATGTFKYITPGLVGSSGLTGVTSIDSLVGALTTDSTLDVTEPSPGNLAITVHTGTSGAAIPFLNGTNTWSGAQSFNSSNFILKGSSSGTLTVKPAAAAGSNTLTLPAGTTDFSATGGTSQVVKQTSAGGALTVAQLACADLSDATSGCSTPSGTLSTSTGATTISFTSALPSAAKEIDLSFIQLSLSGTDNIYLQVGYTGGTYETSGYVGSASKMDNGVSPVVTSGTSGCPIIVNDAAVVVSGVVRLTRIGNYYTVSGTFTQNSGAHVGVMSCFLSASAVLDSIRLISTGSDTFDANGGVNWTAR